MRISGYLPIFLVTLSSMVLAVDIHDRVRFFLDKSSIRDGVVAGKIRGNELQVFLELLKDSTKKVEERELGTTCYEIDENKVLLLDEKSPVSARVLEERRSNAYRHSMYKHITPESAPPPGAEVRGRSRNRSQHSSTDPTRNPNRNPNTPPLRQLAPRPPQTQAQQNPSPDHQNLTPIPRRGIRGPSESNRAAPYPRQRNPSNHGHQHQIPNSSPSRRTGPPGTPPRAPPHDQLSTLPTDPHTPSNQNDMDWSRYFNDLHRR